MHILAFRLWQFSSLQSVFEDMPRANMTVYNNATYSLRCLHIKEPQLL